MQRAQWATPVNGCRICTPDATVECHNLHTSSFVILGCLTITAGLINSTLSETLLSPFLKLVPSYSHILVAVKLRSKHICQTTYRGAIKIVIVYCSSVNIHTSSSLVRIIHEPGKGKNPIFLCFDISISLYCTGPGYPRS